MRGGCVPEGAAGAGAAGGAGGRAGVTGAAPRTSDPEAARCPLRPAEGHGRAPRAAHGCVTVELCLSPCSGRLPAMERAVEPWGPDLRGREEREQLRGARTGECRGDAPP